MKKILMILTEFPPAIGGMQTHAIMLLKNFYEKGAELTVYTYRNMDEDVQTEETDQQFNFSIHRKLTRIAYHKNLDVLRSAVTEFKPDLIYSSTVFYGILEKMTGVPVICRSVGNDIMRPWIVYPFRFGQQIMSSYLFEKYMYKIFKKMNKPELVEQIFRKRRLQLTLKAAKSASTILANSHFTQGLLKQAGVGEKNIEIVVGGVDSQFFNHSNPNPSGLRKKLGLPSNRKILLTACRLVDKKGVDFLIKAMLKLKNQNFGFHLLIVGDGRRKKQLEKLAKKLRVNHKITFAGKINYECMPEYYWAADIFVLASTVFVDKKTGLKDAETMGRVLCEANAAKIPVVATNSGGISSVITHQKNGLLFPENNQEQFLNCVERICTEPDLKAQLVNNGQKMALNHFDWQHIINTHETVFIQNMKKSPLEPHGEIYSG